MAALVIICGYVTHPGPASGSDQPQAHAGPGAPVPVLLPSMSPSWFLNRTRRLLNEGRAAEAYQLARAALDLYPRSTELRLGAAFAAMQTGRCQLAIRHLEPLRDRVMAAMYHRQARAVRTACQGVWRWQALIGATTGYRPSLVDRQRDVEIWLQPGSHLHGICLRLAALCDPARPLVARGGRDSGIDLWTDLTIRHLYRADTEWDVDLETILFQRRPRRSGYEGDGAVLRLAALSRQVAGRRFRFGAEAGAARFQQGRVDLTISQTHRRADIGLFIAHAAGLQSRIGAAHLTVRSQWLDLAQTRYEYRLEKRFAGPLTMSLGGARERSRQTGPGLMPGSQAHEMSIDLRWVWEKVATHLHHARRHQSFLGQLPFLAAPHRARTRTTRLDLMNGTGVGWLNLKVVLSFEYRKISTLDPFRLPASKTLLLRISREIFSSR
jgi:hypothetical protein